MTLIPPRLLPGCPQGEWRRAFGGGVTPLSSRKKKGIVMVDLLFNEINEGDSIVFIKNKRGEKPRLLFGTVDLVFPKSLIVQKKNGDFYRLRYSQRSLVDGQMINVTVIQQHKESTGNTLDCTGYPVFIGDEVVFMEVPSQGFSTSLVVGNVMSIADEGITITVKSSVYDKYMRKPDEIAVISRRKAR